jgi:surface antigen
MLTPGERQAAEEATSRALEGGVGSNVGWESADRAGVSGSSSVTRERVLRNGTVCRDVTEVAIADGEEVTVIENYCQGEGGRWQKQERT